MSDTTNQVVDSGQGITSSGSNGGAYTSAATSSMSVSGISNPLAALVAAHHQPHGYPSLDSNTALLMSNAAATIGAVAAQAMKQMAAQQRQHINPPSNTGFPASLYAALQGSHNNPLVSASGTSSVASAPASLPPSSHAALLAALAGSRQQQSGLTGFLSPGSHDTAAGLLRSSSAVVPQPTPSSSALTSPALLSNMQSWTSEQLEQHVAVLQQANQSIPQSVALLFAEAQRKEKKKNAKRVANRKSASTSRARKKALVEEMTKTNARLKRQALILALLPDLVITTTPEGEITFCSAQVERILLYKPEDLIGAKLYDLVVPSSRDALKCLIEDLIHPGKAKAARASAAAKSRRGSKRRLSDQRALEEKTGMSTATAVENAVGNDHVAAREGSDSRGPSSQGTSSVAAVVSEQSFPLSVVEVESAQQGQNPKPSATNENFDTSTNNSGASGEDDSGGAIPERKRSESKKRPRSDDSFSLSSNAKNLRANDNLDRNVRWHNQRILKGSKKASPDDGPKDDVTGASVTANNAGARLSSLKHVPVTTLVQKKDQMSRYENAGDQSSSDDSLLAGVEEKKKGENASDDSGYRESNDSREETSSSGSDTSQSNDRCKKYMAPTIRMCLVRDDLTTVWCEVTSSIRDRVVEEEAGDENDISKSTDNDNNTMGPKPDQKELLLCLRPVRDGDKRIDESLRFLPPNRTEAMSMAQDSQDVMISSAPSNKLSNRPPKKRSLATTSLDSLSTHDEAPQRKRSKDGNSRQSSNASDTEKSVVESLLKMNQSSL